MMGLAKRNSERESILEPAATSLYEGRWTRVLLWLMRWLPDRLLLGMVPPVCVAVVLGARQQREAVMSNLRAIFPEFGAVRLWRSVHAVFTQFALTYLDRLWHMHFRRPIAWEFQDDSTLAHSLRKPGGVLLFSLHSGNYDIAASLIQKTFHRQLHIVRKRERTESLQQLRQQELESCPGLHVHYNDDPWSLGVELCELLNAGEVVAVLADRALPGLSCATFASGDLHVTIPKGPLILAQIAGVPCFPIFLTRLGVCRYRARCGPILLDGGQKKSIEQIGDAWLPMMLEFLEDHFDQWFVFEKVIVRQAVPRGGWSRGS